MEARLGGPLPADFGPPGLFDGVVCNNGVWLTRGTDPGQTASSWDSVNVAHVMGDWRPRYLFDPRGDAVLIVTDRVLIYTRGEASLIRAAHVLAARARTAYWPTGHRRVVAAWAEQPGNPDSIHGITRWLPEPEWSPSVAHYWVRDNAVGTNPFPEAVAAPNAGSPAEALTGVNLDRAIREAARDDQPWAELTDQIAHKITLAVKVGDACVFSAEPYYVQVSAGQQGLLMGEAVSNAYLKGSDVLDEFQQRALRRLGWLDPLAQHRLPNYWRAWEAHNDPHTIARPLSLTLRCVYGVTPQLVHLR